MKMLNFIHGENPGIVDYITVHLVAPLTALAMAFAFQREVPPEWTLFQWVVYGLIGWDTIGGAAATLSASTYAWWSFRPWWMRPLFVLGHVVQPLALHFFFQVDLLLVLKLWAAVALAALSAALPASRSVSSAAITVMAIGTWWFLQSPPGWEWLGLALALKLVLGLSARRSSLNKVSDEVL